jgi:hypothetical protein
MRMGASMADKQAVEQLKTESRVSGSGCDMD